MNRREQLARVTANQIAATIFALKPSHREALAIMGGVLGAAARIAGLGGRALDERVADFWRRWPARWPRLTSGEQRDVAGQAMQVVRTTCSVEGLVYFAASVLALYALRNVLANPGGAELEAERDAWDAAMVDAMRATGRVRAEGVC